jgi:hypothetical protein
MSNGTSVVGMKIHGKKSLNRATEEVCEPCCLSKSHRRAVNKQPVPPKEKPGQKVYCDIKGPITPASINGSRYAVGFTDSHSHFTAVYFLKQKSELLQAFQKYIAQHVLPNKHTVSELQADSMSEVKNDAAMIQYCAENGTHRSFSTPYCQWQNGLIERRWREISEKSRAIRIRANLNLRFWEHAWDTAVYVINRTVSSALDKRRTPYELWNNRKPNIDHLRVFGCTAYVHHEVKINTLTANAWKGIFVGYDTCHHTYMIYKPTTQRISYTRNVKFDENSFQYLESNVQTEDITNVGRDIVIHGSYSPNVLSTTNGSSETPEVVHSNLDPNSEPDGNPPKDPEPSRLENSATDLLEHSQDTTGISDELESVDSQATQIIPNEDSGNRDQFPLLNLLQSSQLRSHHGGANYWQTPPEGSKRPSTSPFAEVQTGLSASVNLIKQIKSHKKAFKKHIKEMAFAARLLHTIESDPDKYKDAMQSSRAEGWQVAMTQEINQLTEMNVFELIPVDQVARGRKVLGSRWVYKTKRNADGTINKLKARFVVQGCAQIPGVDFGETFAPVVRLSTLRIALSIACAYDLEIRQADIRNAYIHAPLCKDENTGLTETVFIQPPEGFVKRNHKGIKMIWKLLRNLYGLRQAAKAFHELLKQWLLLEMGLEQSASDSCLFLKGSTFSLFFVCLYVDDITYGGTKTECEIFESRVCKAFNTVLEGDLHFMLGMEITRDRANRTLKITHTNYISQQLEKFGLTESNPSPTPITPSNVPGKDGCPKTKEETVAMTEIPYRSLVGALAHTANCVRPDISLAIQKLQTHQANPGFSHWKAAKRVARYLHGTKHIGLLYTTPTDYSVRVEGCKDSDWAGDPDSRKSTMGYLFFINGGPVSWAARHQRIVAQSSNEAEYIALSEACKEASWMKQLLNHSFNIPLKSLPMSCDNTGAIALSKNPTLHKKAKHFEVRHHAVRQLVATRVVSINHIRSEKNPADILTKALTEAKFKEQRSFTMSGQPELDLYVSEEANLAITAYVSRLDSRNTQIQNLETGDINTTNSTNVLSFTPYQVFTLEEYNTLACSDSELVEWDLMSQVTKDSEIDSQMSDEKSEINEQVTFQNQIFIRHPNTERLATTHSFQMSGKRTNPGNLDEVARQVEELMREICTLQATALSSEVHPTPLTRGTIAPNQDPRFVIDTTRTNLGVQLAAIITRLSEIQESMREGNAPSGPADSGEEHWGFSSSPSSGQLSRPTKRIKTTSSSPAPNLDRAKYCRPAPSNIKMEPGAKKTTQDPKTVINLDSQEVENEVSDEDLDLNTPPSPARDSGDGST